MSNSSILPTYFYYLLSRPFYSGSIFIVILLSLHAQTNAVLAQSTEKNINVYNNYLIIPLTQAPITHGIPFTNNYVIISPKAAFYIEEKQLLEQVRRNSLDLESAGVVIDPSLHFGLTDFADNYDYSTFTGGFFPLFFLDTAPVLEMNNEKYVIYKLKYEAEEVNYYPVYEGSETNYWKRNDGMSLVITKLLNVEKITKKVILRNTRSKYELESFQVTNK